MTCTDRGWIDFLKEGNNCFLKAKRWAEIGKFSNDLIYNLVLMSIEKNFMALCLKNNYLPENHTISDLISAVNKVSVLENDLEKRLLEIEKYQKICTINDYIRKTDQIENIEFVVRVGNEVNELAQGSLQ